MNANCQQTTISTQAYRELLSILQKPYQDVCLVCEGTGKTAGAQSCQKCKGSGHRWLRLI